ncbi:hypothetical protein PB16LOC_04506 [Pectobacterium versatile]|uniref:hypothetical protein n=1 Tax=Pectobacterium versatile TaxID=2488639 RepID=UPI000F8DD8C9|nr:hypothetical protein [Pectobacterium versatile]RUR87278.1 hypothetical protein PB16LOC_04506 [Pectobacterium versatile]
MKNKLLITVLMTASLIPSLVQAFGNQNEWVSGWGQGVSEYSILGKGKSRLYLACEDSGYRPEVLIFTDVNGHSVSTDTNEIIKVKIDDDDAFSVSETSSRVGANNFAWMWDKFRTGKRVIVSGSGVKPAAFTLNGAKNVLPEYSKTGCTPSND